MGTFRVKKRIPFLSLITIIFQIHVPNRPLDKKLINNHPILYPFTS